MNRLELNVGGVESMEHAGALVADLLERYDDDIYRAAGEILCVGYRAAVADMTAALIEAGVPTFVNFRGEEVLG